jgi:hypothetical protein
VNANNDKPFLKADIEALREETPRADAKGELILKLQQGETKKPMSLFKKLTIPATVTALAVIGGMTLLKPTVVASPASVAKALREAMNYTIRSFSLSDGKRVLLSEANVENGKKSIQHFDSQGAKVDSPKGMNSITAGHLGGTFMRLNKDMKDSVGIAKVEQDLLESVNSGSVKISKGDMKVGGLITHDKGNARVVVGRTKSGKPFTKYFVQGKEVKEIPESLKGLRITNQANNMQIFSEKDAAEARKKVHTKQMSVVGVKDGKANIFTSGSTSAEYLIKLLEEETQWNIERGVLVNGQRLDKFTFKNRQMPIQLFVDPASSLPKVLLFSVNGLKEFTIEDVYEYGVQPAQNVK